jgi:hypothetical protein
MHGMLSLAVLVAACAGLAGWVGYLLVRLYRACPAPRATLARPRAGDPAGPLPADDRGDDLAEAGETGDLAEPRSDNDPAEEPAATPQPVA